MSEPQSDLHDDDNKKDEMHSQEEPLQAQEEKHQDSAPQLAEVKVKEKVSRIPWRQFIRSQLQKIVGTIIILALMVRIIYLSRQINGDPDLINPDNIISKNGSDYVELMILSSVVYLLILGFFSKLVFFDHKEDFGIKSYKSLKSALFFLLTIAFISLVYALFDVALINIYLEALPVYLVWILRNELHLNLPFVDRIPQGIDRQSYADIRGGMFLGLFVFTLLFPLAMSIAIFTRYGRRQLQERRQKPRAKYGFKDWLKFILVLPLEFVLLTLFFVINNFNPEIPFHLVIVFFIIIIGIWWIIQVIILILRGIKTLSFLMYSNAAMILPIILVFYVLPGLLWATWDLFSLIINHGDVSNTIYSIVPQSMFSGNSTLNPMDSGFDITTLSTQNLLQLYWQTLLLNLGNFFRILELDFVLVIGVASAVIGFAEGYSLFAIFRSIFEGVSIARTGRVAEQSSPKIIVISTQFLMLGAWAGLLWDKFIVIYSTLTVDLNLPLPDLGIKRFFEHLFGYAVNIENLGGIFVAISILIVPLYFIITSSFKFLSVSLVADKIKDDTQVFFFLTSSAFTLIAAQILADIAAIPSFQNENKSFLPLQSTATSEFLPFISKIFEQLEAFGFYLGAIVSIFVLLKYFIMKARGKSGHLFNEL